MKKIYTSLRIYNNYLYFIEEKILKGNNLSLHLFLVSLLDYFLNNNLDNNNNLDEKKIIEIKKNKKNRKKITIWIPIQLSQKIDDISKKNKISRSDLINYLIKIYIKK